MLRNSLLWARIKAYLEAYLWEKVKALEGETVNSITTKSSNKILRVAKNMVKIKAKYPVSFKSPTGIFANYHTFIKDGYLIGESGKKGTMKPNLHGRYVIMAILLAATPDEIEKIKGGIRLKVFGNPAGES